MAPPSTQNSQTTKLPVNSALLFMTSNILSRNHKEQNCGENYEYI